MFDQAKKKVAGDTDMDWYAKIGSLAYDWQSRFVRVLPLLMKPSKLTVLRLFLSQGLASYLSNARLGFVLQIHP